MLWFIMHVASGYYCYVCDHRFVTTISSFYLVCVFVVCVFFFFFKQKTAYEMRISDWSSDVCSSDLFALATVFIFIIGIILLATLALITPFLQNLLGYPVVTAGLVMGPRGIGTMLAMVLVGRLIGRIETRVLILAGLGLTILALHRMSGYTDQVTSMQIMIDGMMQGAGLGLIFVPLSTMAFATLPRTYLDEAAGIYSVSRNIGSSIGISVVSALLASNIQVNHAQLVEFINPFNPMLGLLPALAYPATGTGRPVLDQMINRQATLIAYLNDFKLMMWVAIAAIPMLLLMREPKRRGGRSEEHTLNSSH